MNEIKLTVDDKNLPILLTLLENLKEGLVSELVVNGKTSRTPSYQPKHNRVIKEEESGTRDTSGKYASAALYKQRLHSKK